MVAGSVEVHAYTGKHLSSSTKSKILSLGLALAASTMNGPRLRFMIHDTPMIHMRQNDRVRP